ncbi:MAG TPA: DsbA family protein [Gemmatimonadales bacterium]|jgi:protein-disulfide isomerase|nr:DsbA family protein [Gemmatimonadales bacterium]
MQRIGSFILVACALTITLLIARRELFPSGGGTGGGTEDVRIARTLTPAEWSAVASKGHFVGAERPIVTVVVFSDFECPACRQFAMRSMPGALAAFPNDLRIVLRHWPLEYHRFAYPSARAAECAAEQGRFKAFHDIVFQSQDSLGLLPFVNLALRAGVPDTSAFSTCSQSSTRVLAIEDDLRAADDIGGGGTPTIIIQGSVLASPPDSGGFSRRIAELVAQR